MKNKRGSHLNFNGLYKSILFQVITCRRRVIIYMRKRQQNFNSHGFMAFIIEFQFSVIIRVLLMDYICAYLRIHKDYIAMGIKSVFHFEYLED